MRRAVEVLIIGGGVVGCSIAYHLARRGVRDVTVLEQAAVGSGASGKAAGGIRQQFSTPVCVRLSLLSLEAFARFEAEMGVDPDFQRCGYLLVTARPDEMAAFERNVAMQRGLGVKVRLVTPDEVATIHPWLRVDDLVGGTFCPTDGVAGPAEVTAAFQVGIMSTSPVLPGDWRLSGAGGAGHREDDEVAQQNSVVLVPAELIVIGVADGPRPAAAGDPLA